MSSSIPQDAPAAPSQRVMGSDPLAGPQLLRVPGDGAVSPAASLSHDCRRVSRVRRHHVPQRIEPHGPPMTKRHGGPSSTDAGGWHPPVGTVPLPCTGTMTVLFSGNPTN